MIFLLFPPKIISMELVLLLCSIYGSYLSFILAQLSVVYTKIISSVEYIFWLSPMFTYLLSSVKSLQLPSSSPEHLRIWSIRVKWQWWNFHQFTLGKSIRRQNTWDSRKTSATLLDCGSLMRPYHSSNIDVKKNINCRISCVHSG